MKKKIIAAAAIAVLAVSFGGCSSGNGAHVPISEEVMNANPWTDHESLDEAAEIVGFTIESTGDVELENPVYRVCKGINLLEIQGDNGNMIRKAEDDGDISGNYTEYDYTSEITSGEITATVKGESEDVINVIIWQNGKFAYAVNSEKGFTAEETGNIIADIK